MSNGSLFELEDVSVGVQIDMSSIMLYIVDRLRLCVLLAIMGCQKRIMTMESGIQALSAREAQVQFLEAESHISCYLRILIKVVVIISLSH